MTYSPAASPKIIPGGSGPSPRLVEDFEMMGHQCVQYGPQDLLACPSFSSGGRAIFVYDMNSVLLVQTLCGHRTRVTCVQWRGVPVPYQKGSVHLYSADTEGTLILWDVSQAIMLGELQLPCRGAVQTLLPLNEQQLLVVTVTAAAYIVGAHLATGATAVAHAQLPISVDPRPPLSPSFENTSNNRTSSISSTAERIQQPFQQYIRRLQQQQQPQSQQLAAVSLPPLSPVLTSPQRPVALHCRASRLTQQCVLAFVLKDRLRVINDFQPNATAPTSGTTTTTTTTTTSAGRGLSSSFADTENGDGQKRKTGARAKDVIYDIEDDDDSSSASAASVIDSFFSEAQEEVVYFATRHFVGTYDWKLGMILNEELLWLNDDVEFRRLFSSHAAHPFIPATATLPLLYSFGSDQRLVAWHAARGGGRHIPVAVDARGARIPAKSVAAIAQSARDPACFAIVLEDGTIVKWRYRPHERRWVLLRLCAHPVQRASCVCHAGPGHVCCALESGVVVVIDVEHNTVVRRFNLVYSGGTSIVHLCPHRWDGLVWVATNRVAGGSAGGNRHQVSLLDTRTGAVARVLRRPPVTATEPSTLKEMTMDATSSYVLLTFWNGTFEVWHAEDGRLLHMHSGLGVANTSWAPASMRRCLTGLQGSPQLLAVLFSEGTVSFWSVYKDRVIASRDAIPLIASTAVDGGTVRSVAVGDTVVFFDSSGSALALGYMQHLSLRRLRDLPQGVGRVTHLASSSSSSSSQAPFLSSSGGGAPDLRDSSQSSQGEDPPEALGEGSFASGTLSPVSYTTPVTSAIVTKVDGENQASSFTSPLILQQQRGHSLVAATFVNGSVGVWCATSGQRRGYSEAPSSPLKGIQVRGLIWLQGGTALLLVTTAGSLIVTDAGLQSVNSGLHTHALRRPMQNFAFLPPAQRTYMLASLELFRSVQEEEEEKGTREQGGLASTSKSAQTPASAAVQGVDVARRPCRGPYGQVIPEHLHTLDQELALYARTMLFCSTSLCFKSGDRPLAAYEAANALGKPAQVLLLWAQVSRHHRTWLSAANPLAGTALSSLLITANAASGAYLHPNPLSETTAPSHIVRSNRAALSALRSTALASNKVRGVDDTAARLRLAREFVRLHQASSAVQVLLDADNRGARYGELATLAVALSAAEALHDSAAAAAAAAGCNGVGGGGGGGVRTTNLTSSAPPFSSAAEELFVSTSKRAAAMLLASGDVDAAVEKYLLAGDTADACLSLESCGRWRCAAVLARLSAHQSRCFAAGVGQEGNQTLLSVLRRCAEACAKHGDTIPAVCMLLGCGLVREALLLLSSSSHFTDVAGQLAVQLALCYSELREDIRFPSGAVRDGDGGSAGSSTLADVMLSVLADYRDTLDAIGNWMAARRVLDLIGELKQATR